MGGRDGRYIYIYIYMGERWERERERHTFVDIYIARCQTLTAAGPRGKSLSDVVPA